MHRLLGKRISSVQLTICVLFLIWQRPVQSGEMNKFTPNSNDAYCAPKLCHQDGTELIKVEHVACGNNGSFASNCGPSPNLLEMNEMRRNFILDLHNLIRAHIASGQLKGYSSAAHMPILKWDNELEYLASLNAKRCNFEHDQCRNTAKYESSGQNIAYLWQTFDLKSHIKPIKDFVMAWFKEYVYANQTYIDSFHLHENGKTIGHFTQLVNDRTHHIGCAVIHYRKASASGSPLTSHELLMTCNYDYINMYFEPVYETGKAASKCVLKPNEKYPSLCDWN